jgi:tetratricopeptide (TPR) repeat protein
MSRPARISPLCGIAFCGLVLFAACSVKRDAWTNRTYHGLVSRDNGWFNANEKLKEVMLGIEQAFVYDFDTLLPVFVLGTKEQISAAQPELEKCVDKCAVVIDRHSMDFEGKQRNNWIDDSYFVLGKARFHQGKHLDAERVFGYLGKRMKGHDRQLEGKLWRALNAVQMEQYAKAQSTLDELRQEDLPRGFPLDLLEAVQASVYLHRDKVDDAVTALNAAVDHAERKWDKVRWAFLIAQLHQQQGRNKEAVDQYARVERMGPPYELAFHSQIFQALAFDAGSSKALRSKLQRMLRDDKHKDHYDMILYALADIELKEGHLEEGVAQLKKSALANTKDTRQKAKSWLRIADVYFQERRYAEAQVYYDSTTTLLSKDHMRWQEVANKAEVLAELVEHLSVVQKEDSLQHVATLDERERENLARQAIRQREQQEEEAAAREAAAREVAANAPPAPATTQAAGSKASWYFYNGQSIARGMAEFKKKWGPRANEDDWRRSNRGGSATASIDEEEDEKDEEGRTADGEAAWKDPAWWMRDLPLDSAAILASNARICEALYKSGLVYKEKLTDIDNAVESFENLNTRFNECTYTPESYYQLYRIYLEKERSTNFFSLDGTGSLTYANIILERYPESEFARLVRDPNALGQDAAGAAARAAAYMEIYAQFKSRAYTSVITASNAAITERPDDLLAPKYALLKALCIGSMQDKDGYRSALSAVQTGYPSTEEGKHAGELLASLGGGERSPDAPSATPPPTPYTIGEGKHFVAMVCNAPGGAEPLKVQLANYLQAHFAGQGLQVSANVLEAPRIVLLVSQFPNSEKAMEYLGAFMSESVMLRGSNDQGYPVFAITPANYALLVASKDVSGYQDFFGRNYPN